jgi:hypothetical protein
VLGADAEAAVHVRVHLDVANARRDEADRTRQACVPPLVLVLDEARVRPPEDDGNELVRAVVAYEVADVELGGRPCVLGDADRLAVHENVEHAFSAGEVQHDGPRPPAARNRERPPVDTGLVLLRHLRRRIVERHHDVRVVRPPEALHRPEPGDLDLLPAARCAERVRCVLGPPDEAEVPAPGQIARPRSAARERRRRRQAVEARELRQHPARPAADREQRRKALGARAQIASRSAWAAVSGATGLK